MYDQGDFLRGNSAHKDVKRQSTWGDNKEIGKNKNERRVRTVVVT